MPSDPVPDARARGQGVPFQRIRRITGYLVGTLDRFNNAKRAEERERVKHGMGGISELASRGIFMPRLYQSGNLTDY